MSNPLKRKIAKEFEEEKEPIVIKKSNPVIPLINENQWRTDNIEYGLVIKKQSKDEPILSKNAIPVSELLSEKQKYKIDVELRPDDVDYDKMPIEDFGSALLRGMGWKEGKPVGKNPKGIVDFVQVQARPSLLGLGAEPLEIQEKKKKVLPGDVIVEPKVKPQEQEIAKHDFRIGLRVLVTSGSKKGKKGTILEIVEKRDGIVIKIKSDSVISVWDDQIEVDEPNWLRPNIRVRIISKSFEKGQYYNRKCIVQDVVKKGHCIVKLDNLTFDMKQYQLETVIPQKQKMVMVVRSQDVSIIGQLGHLIDYDSKKETVLVQLDHTYEYLVFFVH